MAKKAENVTFEIPEEEEAAPQEQEPTSEPPKPIKEESVPLARFNEVYAQWKSKEREAASLEERLSALEQRLSTSAQPEPEPDPSEDPDAWKDWYKKQAAPREEPKPQQQKKEDNTMVEVARMMWSDYDQVVGQYIPQISNNEAIQRQIMNSSNPPAEVYRLAKAHLEGQQSAKEMNFESPSMEGDEFFEKETDKLAPEERAMAERFGMTEKEWKGHKKAIAKDRSRMFGGKIPM